VFALWKIALPLVSRLAAGYNNMNSHLYGRALSRKGTIMRIAKLLSVALVVVFAASLIGCNKPTEPERGPGAGATTQPADKVATVVTVNSKCPLMGDKINHAAMSVDMVRDFNGQKVGFCCTPCMPKWDALTEIEKTAKLAAVMVPVP
jgi:hypothetical protein